MKPSKNNQVDLFPVMPEKAEFKHIPVSEFPENAELYRAKNAGMIKNIETLSVLQPVVLCKSDTDTDGATFVHSGQIYEVLAGRSRIVNARAAGIAEIPAMIFENIDGAIRSAITISENNIRSDNSVTDFIAVSSLIKVISDKKTISDRLGISLKRVEKLLKLFNLIPEMQARFIAQDIRQSIAFKIARLPKADQEKLIELDEITDNDILKIRQAKVAELPDYLFDIDGVVNAENTVEKLLYDAVETGGGRVEIYRDSDGEMVVSIGAGKSRQRINGNFKSALSALLATEKGA